MLGAIFLLSTVFSVQPCSTSVVDNRKWLVGDQFVEAVKVERQDAAIRHLKNKRYRKISYYEAENLISRSPAKKYKYYYLIKAKYYGERREDRSYPSGLSLAADIDVEGVAFVLSNRLTSEKNVAELAVVLGSNNSVAKVELICGAVQ